jgi:hypothetical protein
MEAEARLKTLEIRLLSLFEPDGGYLYLLDETSGSPLIPDGDEAVGVVVLIEIVCQRSK